MAKRILIGVAGILLSTIGLAAEIRIAKKIAHYWIDGSAGSGISGLSFCKGNLLTISDKNSEVIYTIKLEDGLAQLEPYLEISGLKAPKKDKPTNFWHFILDLSRPSAAMDFEGICCTDDAIYILSERYNRIAKVDMHGKANWLESVWSFTAKARGYLQGFNLSSEGLAKVGDNFWVALERDPRGLVKLTENEEAQIYSPPPVAGLDFHGKSEDFSALDYYDGALFTLERNAHAVCKRSVPSLKAEWCLDYRALEQSPELEYEGASAGGKGDGLAVGEEGIFILFDNNNISRSAVPQDRRALLLQLAVPESTR